MEMIREYFMLNPIGINHIIELIDYKMQTDNVQREERLRFCLTLEECLLFWMEHLEGEKKCWLKYGKQMNALNITVFCPGIQNNPLVLSSDDEDPADAEYMHSLLARLGLALTYSYKNNVNRLSFQQKQKSALISSGICLSVLGAIATIFILGIMPQSLADAFLTYAVSPFRTLFFRLLSAIIGPFVFLTILLAIAQAGDITSLRKRGGLILSRFTLNMVVMAVIAVLASLMVFRLQWGMGTIATNINENLFSFFVNIVPSDIISPFVENNMMQLLFMAIFAGSIMLMLRERIENVVSLTDQIYKCFVASIAAVTKFLPIYIYCNIVLSFRQLEKTMLINFIFLVLICCLLMLLFVLFLFMRVKYRCGISAKLLFKKLRPSAVLLLSTASSSASFWHTKKLCSESLGISKNCTDVGLSLGIMIYMLGTLVFFTMSSVCMASFYGISVNFQWMILLVFLATTMTMSMTSISDAELMCITGIFISLGIPESGALPIYIVGILLDGFVTAINVISLELTLVLCAEKLNELDMEKLNNATV